MTLQADVLEVVAASPEPWTTTEVATMLEIEPTQAAQAMSQLTKKGLLDRVGKGIYRYRQDVDVSATKIERIGEYDGRVILAIDGVLGAWTPIG